MTKTRQWLLLSALMLVGCSADEEQFTISGFITDQELNTPIAGATLNTEPTTRSVKSDAGGHYTIESSFQKARNYHVVANATGFHRFRSEAIAISTPGDYTLDVEMLARQIEGLVSDADTGAPVSGADVFVDELSDQPAATTGAEGSFTVRVDADGPISVEVAHPDYTAWTRDDVSIPDGENPFLDVSLQR